MIKKLRYFCTLLLIAVASGAWADDVTGTITFGTNNVKINAASVTGDDDLENTWTITTVGTTSFTTNTDYYQVGSGNKPATSITFTTTLPEDVEITSMSAKFGGFNGTAGTITLKVGDTSIGTGSLNASNDVTVTNTSTATGTVLTVTVTGISKGVKVYNISYTYANDDPSDQSVETSVTIDASGITNTDVYTGTAAGSLSATVNAGEATVDGATVTWSSSKENVATIDENTGEVTLVGKGTTTITASYAGVSGEYKASSATYELTVTSSEPYVQPTEVVINMNYQWLGSGNGSNLSSNQLPVVKDDDNVITTITDGTSIRPRGDSDYIRLYKGSTLKFDAPDGYVITAIEFTTGRNNTWNAPSASAGTLSEKTWTGSAQSVTFTLNDGNCFISTATITLGEPSSDPVITVTPDAVNEDAAAHEGTLAISYENLEISGTDDFAVEFCDEDGESLPSNPEWVIAEVEQDVTGGYVVSYVIVENTATEERTAYLKVSAIGEEDVVYSNIVTITQAGFAEEVSYKLVKANYELTSGRYLIFSTETATLFDGSLETLDAANNYQVSPNVIEGIIKTDKDIYFTLEKVAGGYTIKSASGKYIGRTSSSNGINTSDTEAYLNTISFDKFGNALISSNGLNLRFNKTSGQMRFRYFTSEQTAIALYKEVTDNEAVLVTIKDGFEGTTFSCDKALDFTNVEGITASIITDANGTTEAVEQVRAETGLYISGEPGSYEVPVIAQADEVTGNLLEAVLTDTPYASDGETTYYAYGKNNGTEAFWKIPATAALTVPANKAVLALPTAQAAKEMIVIGGDVTAIDNLQLTIDNGAIYNLQGQKVNKAQKGVFIQNGRKIVVK